MSTPLTSFSRAGNGDANGVEWKDYSVDTRGPGQWDEVTAELEGYWASPWAARLALLGKKISPPGMAAAGGYGFYIADGSLRTSWAKGGRVRAEIQAPGLAARKWKKIKLNAVDSYSLTNVTTGPTPPTGLTGSFLYDRLQFKNTKAGYDVNVAWAPGAGDSIDFATAGRTSARTGRRRWLALRSLRRE